MKFHGFYFCFYIPAYCFCISAGERWFFMDYIRAELEILMKKLRELEKNYIEEIA